MRIALVADSSSPRARLSQNADPGSGAQTARVASVAAALACLGHRIAIYARKGSRGLPGSAILAPGVTVEPVTAGPPTALDADELTAHLPEFGHYLAQRWRRNPPDIAHAHFWTSGLAALAGARDLGVPRAQTFRSQGAPQQGCQAADWPAAAPIRPAALTPARPHLVLARPSPEPPHLPR